MIGVPREIPKKSSSRGALSASAKIRAWPPRAVLPPCDAVVAVGEVLNYLARPADFDAAFRRAFRALQPGGVMIFDAKGPSGPSGPLARGRSGRGWAVLSTSREGARGVLTREIVSFRRVGRTYRRAKETHRILLLPIADLARRLRAAGFTVEVARGYGAFRVPRGHAVLLARRPYQAFAARASRREARAASAGGAGWST